MVQRYRYRARTPEGKVVSGVVEASNLESAKKALQQNKLTPLSLEVPRTLLEFVPFFGRIRLSQRSVFARQLSTMLEAGLTLTQSLRLLIRQQPANRYRAVLESLLVDLQEGFSFSSSLAKFPDVFDAVFVSVIRAGEATGKLELVLKQLADNLENDVRVRNKIIGAMVYPAFVVMAMIGAAVVVLVTVIPRLRSIFLEAGANLPWTTQLLIAMSDFVTQQWYIAVTLVFAVVGGLSVYRRSEAGHRFLSQFVLKIPIFGTIVKESSMSRFARLLSMLLSAGVPLLEGLKLIQSTYTNRVYQRAFQLLSSEVERGVPMSAPIQDNPVFPLVVGQMVAVGEQTGKLDEVMEKLARYYDDVVQVRVNTINSLIEPVMIIILGGGVLFLTYAVLFPIYSISQAI